MVVVVIFRWEVEEIKVEFGYGRGVEFVFCIFRRFWLVIFVVIGGWNKL